MSREDYSVESRLLSLLSLGQIVSGEKIASRLKISRQALHKRIELLRQKGYRIDGKPKQGYRIASVPDRLSVQRVLSSIQTQSLGKNIIYLDQTDSTQNQAKKLAGDGCKEGALVIAEKQTAGKGRLGRVWVSSGGGIWASLVFRPDIPPQNVPLLSLVISLAVAEAIDHFCSGLGKKIRCGLKWPNDVMIQTGGNYKKVCGILTEMSAESERVHWVVLGFGINVNNKIPVELKHSASNLQSVAGLKLDRTMLLCSVLEKIEEKYRKFMDHGFADLKSDYLSRCILKGKIVTLSDTEGSTTGRFVGIGEDGVLILRIKNRTANFFAGDVTLIPLRSPRRPAGTGAPVTAKGRFRGM